MDTISSFYSCIKHVSLKYIQNDALKESVHLRKIYIFELVLNWILAQNPICSLHPNSYLVMLTPMTMLILKYLHLISIRRINPLQAYRFSTHKWGERPHRRFKTELKFLKNACHPS